MEPASTLAQAALAVAALVPAQPRIEVSLRNVENKTTEIFQICPVEKSIMAREIVKSPIECIQPGTNKLNTLICFQEFGCVLISTLRLISTSHNNKYINCWVEFFSFVGLPPNPALKHYLQISLIHKVKAPDNVIHINSPPHCNIIWDRHHPPQYIRCEIDATIEGDALENSSLTEEHEMFWLEKIK